MVIESKEPVLLESNQDHATIREDGISTSLVASVGEGGGYVPMVTQGINGDTAGTLDSNYFKGCGEREGTEREVVVCGEVAACLNAQDGRGGVHSQKMSDPEGNFVLEPKIIGNGQTAQMGMHDKAYALDCMHDQQAVMEIIKGDDLFARTQNPILRILQETYGTEKVVEWGIGVLDALQQTKVLQSGMYESGISGKTENRDELDNHSLECPKIVAEWLLRDMWEQQKCGCSPQGQESTEQRVEQSNESMSELPQQVASSSKELFDMWSKGKGLRLLQQTLYQIQEIWKSVLVSREGGDGIDGVSNLVVRRLTPL